MAATVFHKKLGAIDIGQGFHDVSVIDFGGDATVQLGTSVSFVTGAAFTPLKSGGSAYTPSIDGTLDTGHGVEVVNGHITVDVPSPTSDVWVARIWGY